MSVTSFYEGGAFAQDLVAARVPLFELGKRGRWDIARFLHRFHLLVARERPEVLYSFLPVPNLVALATRRQFPAMRVVWGVRSSSPDLSGTDWLEAFAYWAERRLSRYADMSIVNSEAGAALRAAQGFPSHSIRVIRNGIDTERFRYDPDGRIKLRRAWGVEDRANLVGVVGRLDPVKGHATFLCAARQLANAGHSWRFVVVGDGPKQLKDELMALADAQQLAGALTWTGGRSDMAAVYSALDILCLPSVSEGFPNVVAEAMACGRPCVTTDVGDTSSIVGDTGMVVPAGNPAALAAAIKALAARAERDREIGRRARARIKDGFSVERLVEETSRQLGTLAGERRARRFRTASGRDRLPRHAEE